MSSLKPSSKYAQKPPPVIWTQQDDAEYNRLATEMNEDVKLQFTLFTFGVTASTAVLGLLTSATIRMESVPLSGLPYGFFFLVPLVVLLPTSLMILNRARTRNRKASYLMVSLEYKRLCAEGITDQTPLNEVRKYPFLPWETALHILERTNLKEGNRVHLAPALRYMFGSYFTIEIICIALAFYTSIQASQPVSFWFGIIIALVVIPVYIFRFLALRRLTRSDSIQGYAENWLKYKYGTIDNAPQYLQKWITDEVNYTPPRVNLRT